MKICLVTRSLPLHRAGGLEYHTADLAQGLARRDCEIHILTTNAPSEITSNVYPGCTLHFIPDVTPGNYSLAYFTVVSRVIRELHSLHHFDVIHAQGFALLSSFYMKNLPVVVTIHGTLFSETALYREYFRTLSLTEKAGVIWRHKDRLAIYPFYTRYMRRARRILVDSEFTARELSLHIPALKDTIRKVPLGIDPERYPAVDKHLAREKLGLEKADYPVLFTLSRLENMKGIDVALKALSNLKRYKWVYYIGGTGSEEKSLKAAAAELELTDRVYFLGRVSEEDLPHYYSAADLFMYPEKSQPAFGLVALEALLQNTPVVASRAGALPEIITKEVGITFNRNDPEDLRKTLEPLLTNPEMLYAFKDTREYVLTHFSFEQMIESTILVYQEIISSCREHLIV